VGPWDVRVNNTNGQFGTLASGFSVKNPTPTITSITNVTGARGWTVVESITGANFLSGAVVKLVNASAGPDITATNVVVLSGAQITCSFDLTGASPVKRSLTVTNPISDTGTLANGFTVTSIAPTITAAATPAAGAQATTVAITNLVGTGFQPGATVTFTQGAYSIPLTGVTVVSPTKITGNLVIPSLAPAGLYSATVLNTDGQLGSRASTFTVNSNAPTITSITPNTYVRGWTVSITSLAGTNFQNGATVRLVNASAGPDITATSVVVVSAAQITCVFDLTGASAVPRNVTVTNPDGKTATLANGFTITGAAPTFTSIVPATAVHGTTVSITNLAGTLFQPGATVVLRNATTTVSTGTVVNVASPTQITCQFAIPAGTKTGANAYYVVITNSDTKTVSSGNVFSVT
jgi:hypothetical protein